MSHAVQHVIFINSLDSAYTHGIYIQCDYTHSFAELGILFMQLFVEIGEEGTAAQGTSRGRGEGHDRSCAAA